MVRKSKEADRVYKRGYMRVYMRDYRKEKKAKQEREERQIKLSKIANTLKMYYVMIDHDSEWLMVQPEVKLVPQITLERVGVTAKVNGEEVPIYEEKPLAVGTAKKIEKVPKDLQPTVNYVQARCRAEGVLVSEIRVKRGIESRINDSLSDLIAQENTSKLGYFAHQWRKLLKSGLKITDRRVAPIIAEWKALVKKRRDAKEEFDRFVMVSLLAGHTNDEILFSAKADEKTNKVFSHFIEEQAKILIKDFRKMLNLEESMEDEILGKMTVEERDYALEALRTEATARSYVAAKRLVDEKRKRKFTKQPRKKKQKVFHVTVDE